MKHRTDDNRRFPLACGDVSDKPSRGIVTREPTVSEREAGWILGLIARFRKDALGQ